MSDEVSAGIIDEWVRMAREVQTLTASPAERALGRALQHAAEACQRLKTQATEHLWHHQELELRRRRTRELEEALARVASKAEQVRNSVATTHHEAGALMADLGRVAWARSDFTVSRDGRDL